MASSVPAIVWPINYGLPGGNPLTQGVLLSVTLDSAPLIQGDQRLLQLYFLTVPTQVGVATTNVQLIAGTTISVAGKPSADLGSDTLLFEATEFVQLQDGSGLFFYQAFLDLDTDEIIDAFTELGDGNNTLPCLADVIISVPAQAAAGALPATPPTTARYQVPGLLQRQVYLGTESNPSPATPTYPPAAQVQAVVTAFESGAITGTFNGQVTSVGNGAPTSLEALVTATLTVPVLVTIYNVAADELQNWLLLASTEASGAGVQQPLDFNASINAKAWFRK